MLNIKINDKPVYIMALPDYMLPTLKSKGKSLNDFIDNINQLTLHQDEAIADNVLNYLLNTVGLSKYDVLDIYNSNALLVNYLGSNFVKYLDNRYKQNISNDEIANAYSALVNIYNKDIPENFDFNMSNKNSGDLLPFEIIHGGNSVFIVLKNFFSKFSLNVNNLEFKIYLINYLLKSLVSSFTKEELIDSDLFKSLNSMSYLLRQK